MHVVDESIEVEVPASTAYGVWRDFQQFPRFMESVREVRELGDGRSVWTVEIAGVEIEWDAELVTDEANQRLAWRAVGDSTQWGEVTFEEIEPRRTIVTVHIEYKLASRIKETLGHFLGLDDRAVREDLERFKDLVEGRAMLHPA